MSGAEPLAHSAPKGRSDAQPYADHVRAVVAGARANGQAICTAGTRPPAGFLDAVEAGARFHDLGKLDPDNQEALRHGRDGRLPWDHIDAGCAHLVANNNRPAALIVRGHHAPGLPRWQDHFNADAKGAKLRGRRHDTGETFDLQQAGRTDKMLGSYLAQQASIIGSNDVVTVKSLQGLAQRLALSCVVDADHSNTATFESGRDAPAPLRPRWAERLAALDAFIAGKLAEGKGDVARNLLRSRFYDACRNARIDGPIVSCEGPVGIGKTTAVTAFLLNVALRDDLRHVFVVAPYTNIITQTVQVLRAALTLPGENPADVVAEHHHRADFDDIESRELAITWRAPVVVTTAVQFFGTLAARDPAALRKLHQVPRSAVFVDEAHAALPVKLWPQNWLWLKDLAGNWGCRFVLASGSLARFWENGDIVQQPETLPQLMSAELEQTAAAAEHRRVRLKSLGHFETIDGLILAVTEPFALGQDHGPCLVILNTVQSAAFVARQMRRAGVDVMHLSTALCPRDRERILAAVAVRLARSRNEGHVAAPDDRNWVLVATSCVEAGVDLSFRTAYRERFGIANLLQVAGRINRNGEFSQDGGSVAFDFTIKEGDGIRPHPAALHAASVLGQLFRCGALDDLDALPADLVTKAMALELRMQQGPVKDARALCKAEKERDFPCVAHLGRVIDTDTRLVVVEPTLRERLEARDYVTYREILLGSVQLWTENIRKHRLEMIRGRSDIYAWTGAYDPSFLGYMAGVLEAFDIESTGIYIA